MFSQVRAIDNGSPPRHTDHSLTINILDVNDNAPVIESQRGYNVSISEVGVHSHNTEQDVHFNHMICLYFPVELKLNNVKSTAISGGFHLTQ